MVRKIFVVLVKLATKIGFKLKIENIENLPKEGAYIICPNHISFWDTVIIPAYSKRYMYMMAKEELFKNKFVNKVLRSLKAFPVGRGKKDLTAIKTSISLLRKGQAICMFPEGTRSKTGELLKFKTGAVKIACTAKTPILPVGVISDFKFRSKVKIIYGEPIYFDEYYGKSLTKEEAVEATEKVRNAVKELIEKA